MSYRVGIYDPAFDAQGHFVTFDRYIAELCDSPDIELTFLDRDGLMRDAYEGTLQFKNTPSFVTVDRAIENKGWKLIRVLKRYRRYRNTYKAIEKLKMDLVIVTSEAYDPLYYLCPLPRFRYALFVLNSRLYIYKPSEVRGIRWLLFQACRYRYRAYAQHAIQLFSTNEAPILAGIRKQLRVRDIFWIPNMPLEKNQDDELSGMHSTDFITIGTISKSKNHLFALEAFESKTLPFSWVVAGLARDSAGKEVERRVHALEKETGGRVHGEFGYLDDARYTELMRSARFALFPYDLARGNISSQVMHDSFRNRVPFVAPDIEPFRYYANTYGVGLLWRENDPDSFAKTLEEALAQGADSFADGFTRLESDHDFRIIQSRFLKCITPLLAERAK